MTQVAEATGNQGQIKSVLNAGTRNIDEDQTVQFKQYNRVVLPVDGFIFWVGTGVALTIQGSLHHATKNSQDPDESFSIHTMTFTALEAVEELAAISPTTLWLGETDGQQYAFSSRSHWYKQAGLYHYTGDAVYPALSTQIIPYGETPDLADKIVSNSLPIWLTLTSFFPVYPSLLVPDNLAPPYAVIQIAEDDTRPFQAGAWHDDTGTRWQLCRDTVRVVTYGIRNDMILDWLDYVQNYTLNNPTVMGICNSPVPKDAKRGQVEISTIAQKKVITFEVNYYQSRARDIAQQLITSAFLEDVLLPTNI